MLPLLLLLYVGFACLHAFSVPTGKTGYQNAPDEAAHAVYVRNVATFHLPTHDHPTPFTDKTVPNGYEWHQPPLYYVLAAPFLVFGEHGVRLFSILCGVGGLLLIYRGGRMLFPADPVVALVAVGMAALTPTHIAITSTINNDVLLELCFSASLVLLIGALQNGFSRRSAMWLGLSIGAAILTKATGLLLLPVFGAAVLLMWRSGSAPKEPLHNSGKTKELLRNSGITLVMVLLLCGWWFARNQALYGELIPLRLFAADFGHTVQAAPMVERLGGWGAYYLQAGLWTFFSFWAVYGSARNAEELRALEQGKQVLFLEPRIYLLLGMVCLCAVIGLGRLHLQRRTLFTRVQIECLWLLFLTMALVGLAYGVFISKYFQMQGRYMFPAMLPLSLVFGLGFRGLFPERWKNPASALLLVLLGVIAAAFMRYVLP